MPFLTISIPAYNEGESIKTLVEECTQVCKKLNLDFNILIIDDGSSDNTPIFIEELSTQYKNINIITHKKNLGFGITIKEVFQLPKSEWILFLSGDNQFPATNLFEMIKFIDNYDFILGYRTKRNDSIYRRVISFFYNIYISILGNKRIHDVSSIVLTKHSIIEKLNLKAASAFIHAEIYLKAKKNGAKIIEVPILHNKRKHGEASGGKIKIIIFTIFESIKYILGKL